MWLLILNKLTLAGIVCLQVLIQTQLHAVKQLLSQTPSVGIALSAQSMEQKPICHEAKSGIVVTNKPLTDSQSPAAAESPNPQASDKSVAEENLAAADKKKDCPTPSTPGSVPRNHLHWQSLLPGMMK